MESSDINRDGGGSASENYISNDVISDISKIADSVGIITRKKGIKVYIAHFIDSAEYQLRFSSSRPDIYKIWRNVQLQCFLAAGKRTVVVTVPYPTPEKVERTIAKAAAALKKYPRTFMFWGIDRHRYTVKDYPVMETLYDPDISDLPDNAPEIVSEVISAVAEKGAERCAGVFYFGTESRYIFTSAGNSGSYKRSYYRMTVRSFAGPKATGEGIAVGRKVSLLRKRARKAAEHSAELAVGSVNAVVGKPGVYDLIMSPTVGANLLGFAVEGANPFYILGGVSCLGGKLGKKVAPGILSVVDDPTVPEGLNSRPMDAEGTPSRPTVIIDKGIYRNLLHNTSSAKIWKILALIGKGGFKASTTANSYLTDVVMEGLGPKALVPLPTNFVFSTGNISYSEMIRECKRPTLIVHSNWYTRFTNYREGTFSTIPRGGIFLAENGEIRKVYTHLRISDNLLRMMANIEHVGNKAQQIYWWEVSTPTFIPYIKVRDVRFTAPSD